MPTINIQADVSVDVLVQAAEQLSAAELRQFTAQMLALNAKRTAPNVTQVEAFDAAHVEALSKLACLCGVTLAELMRQLDIASPANG